MPDENGGGWGFRPKIRQTVSVLPGRPRDRREPVGQFQTTGTVRMACPSCSATPPRRVWKLGEDAEAAERRGVSNIWVQRAEKL
jgi:hypothetical protein